MSQDRDRCPLCSRKLVMIAGMPTCPDCGYRNPRGSEENRQGRTDARQGIQYGSPDKSNNGMVAGIVIGIIVFFIALAGLTLAGGLYLLSTRGARTEVADSRNEGHSSRGRDSGEKDSPVVGSQTVLRPESAMLVELVRAVFDKDVDQVTQKEMESIVGLNFYELGDSGVTAVEYELADGTFATYFPRSTSLEVSDLNCFGGLEWLMMEQSPGWGTDWSNLTRLRGLSCRASLSEIAGAMDVSRLTWLEVQGGFGSGMEDADKYENLQHLSINAHYVNDLGSISRLTSLRELVLTEAESIQDYEAFYDMPQLELLSIESKGLRDIGFVRGMDNLRTLELIGTDLKRLDAIEDCADTLKVLRLERNYGVEDYSVVFQCTGLEELELYVDYDFDVAMEVPDLSGFAELKRLHLGNYDRFSNLGRLTQLEELTIEDASIGDREALEALTNLKKLSLIDMSVFEGCLDAIPQLTNLETLDLTDSFIWDDISVIFKAPNLKWVYMEDAHAGLEVKNMTPCESLAGLDMTGAILEKMLEDGTWDYNSQGKEGEIALQDVPEFFACLPNLEVLHIPGQELEDVSFLADMKELYYLDVSDNYITDLSPLKGLPRLELVVCTENPLHNREGLEDVLLIE